MDEITFRSGHARHDFAGAGPPLLRVQTAWTCPDRGHSLQLEPVDAPTPDGVMHLRLVVVPEAGGFAPAEPNVLTAEFTVPTEREVHEIVVYPGGATLPVTRWAAGRR